MIKSVPERELVDDGIRLVKEIICTFLTIYVIPYLLLGILNRDSAPDDGEVPQCNPCTTRYNCESLRGQHSCQTREEIVICVCRIRVQAEKLRDDKRFSIEFLD
jgi:hypothetical protein